MSLKRTIEQDQQLNADKIKMDYQKSLSETGPAGLAPDRKSNFPLKPSWHDDAYDPDYADEAEQFQEAVVNIYTDHQQAEEAIKKLQGHGFDMTKLSLIGKDYQTEEYPVGFYSIGDNVKVFGKIGAFFGGLVGLVSGVGLFFVPGIGPIFVAGSFLTTLVGTLEGALVGGSLNAFLGALIGIGIPKNKVLKYENDLKAGKFILFLHGAPEELLQAKEILRF